MNSHRLATFQDIKTEVTNVKQAQSSVKARSGDQWTWMLSRKDPKVLPKVLARNRTQKWCVGITRRKVIELPIAARSKGTTTVESRKVPRKATAKGRATMKKSKANATDGCSREQTRSSIMDPRDYKARRFYIRREVELAKYGFSHDCEECRVAQVGAEVKPHSEGCCGGIR